MQNNLSMEESYINDFHRLNSVAAQREVHRMSLHPFSREQKIIQIQTIKKLSLISKENANKLRYELTRQTFVLVELDNLLQK